MICEKIGFATYNPQYTFCSLRCPLLNAVNVICQIVMQVEIFLFLNFSLHTPSTAAINQLHRSLREQQCRINCVKLTEIIQTSYGNSTTFVLQYLGYCKLSNGLS